MTAPWPSVDPRRRAEFRAELEARVRAVLRGAEPAAGADDWLKALLEIVARMETEVTRRLDRAPEKQQRNFADWLGVKPRSARAARLAAVFKAGLGATVQTAPAPVRVQAPSGAIFETEDDLTILPGALKALAAVSGDRIMLPPPGLFDPANPTPPALRRELLSAAPQGADQLQVTPAQGLAAGGVIRVGGAEHRIVELKGDLVRIEPPLESAAADKAEVVQVTAFAPVFSNAAAAGPRDWQEHELYLGDDEVLNIAAEATIQLLPQIDNVAWAYWGKLASTNSETLAWCEIKPSATAPDTLAKPAGAIEPLERGGVKTRWLRATSRAGETLPLQAIRLAVTSGAVTAFEAVANAAPIASTYDFFPLGAEPRIFDSFYLGCAEAFSKASAKATVTIEVPTATLGPLAAAPFTVGEDAVFFGVGVDGLLYRIVQPASGGGLEWVSLSRPKDGQLPLAGADPKTPVPQDGQPPIVAAPGVALYQGGLVVAAPARGSGEVWLLQADKWTSLGDAAAGAAPTKNAGAVRLVVDGADLKAVVLRDGRLFHARALIGGKVPKPVEWTEVDLGGAKIDELIAYTTGAAPVVVALADGKVTRFVGAVRTGPGPAARPLTQATGADLAAGGQMYAGVSGDGYLVAFTSGAAVPWEIKLDGKTVVGAISLVPSDAGGGPMVLFVADAAGVQKLGVWQPDAGAPVRYLDLGGGGHAAGQGPVAIGHAKSPLTPPSLVLAGDRADLARLDMSAAALTILIGELEDRVAFVPPPGWELIELSDGANHFRYLEPSDGLTFARAQGDPTVVFEMPGFTPTGWRSFKKRGRGPNGAVGFDASAQVKALATDPGLASQNIFPKIGDVIREIGGGDHRVLNDVVLPAEPLARLDPELTGSLLPPDPVDYNHYGETGWGAPEIRPVIDLGTDTARAQAVADAGVIHAADVNASPRYQPLAGRSGAVLLLSQTWIHPPHAVGIQHVFQLPPSAVTPLWQGYEVPANPALSWEYWNGTGWWGLPIEADETGNLRRGGKIRFKVPDDLKPTDVIGKVNHWIRARLIGGDYGHETFTLQTTPGSTPGSSTQSIERNTDTVRPPRILTLTIDYQGPPVTPKHVVTHDNLGWRNQSDANRTPGAVLEVFQTFRDALAAAAPAKGAAATPGGEACLRCEPGAPADTTARPDPAAAIDAGPALYLGLDTPVTPGSVRLFFNLDDQPAARVLDVQALRDGVFTDARPHDATDGLAQSGVLTLALDRPTTLASLFGQELHWIRIRPKGSGPAAWTPAIRGLFLNAAWAAASETQEPEVLGSSNGAPRQAYALTRKPVLPGSLLIRVCETLDDEQIDDLNRTDPDRVVRDPPGFRPGAWVRWDEVPDPLDAAPDARVYGLDEAAGRVSFGDARHGLPPPVGVDNIAAFAYRRGGAGAANGVPPAASLQLVSPLPGVEKVIVGAASAGGADVASAETTLARAAPSLWSRDRAVSLRDIEQLALGSAPEIVQARCEPLRGGGVRAVVVVDAPDPRPGRRACGELAAYLTARAGPVLGGGRLRVEAPTLRPLALDLELVLADTSHTGAVQVAVEAALDGLFDPVSGGLDGHGWPLGASPTDADIAAALVEAYGVLAVTAIRRLTPSGAPFPDRLPMRALVRFSPTDLVIRPRLDA